MFVGGVYHEYMDITHGFDRAMQPHGVYCAMCGCLRKNACVYRDKNNHQYSRNVFLLLLLLQERTKKMEQ